MPQPALSVMPASWTFSSMSFMESPTVSETVQLIVEVAGLCSPAPALEMMRPAGIAPALQCPDESLVPIVSARSLFHVGQRPGDTLAGAMDVLVDGLAGAGLESVFCVPDVE